MELSTPVSLPDWLEPASLSAPAAPSPPIPVTLSQQLREAREYNFGIIFERILPAIEDGRTLTSLINEAAEREPSLEITQFRNWLHKDPKRQARYYEARAIGAECVEDELIEISDATMSMEDVQRSKLRIDTRKWLLSVWNRKRYGEKVENIGGGGGGVVNIIIEGVVSPYQQLNTGVTIEQESDNG